MKPGVFFSLLIFFFSLKITWKWEKRTRVTICRVNLMHECVMGFLWDLLKFYRNKHDEHHLAFKIFTFEAWLLMSCPCSCVQQCLSI